ncbi:hypothetical protein Tco_1169558, partial [Tanacetum coccineum]
MGYYKGKTVNGEVQLQALVDGKKIIVTEASIRSDLQLNDEEGMDFLPNATIFEELTRMGAKTTTWNEFCSTMSFAIIYLATNQKFNFSKYIFESMVKNLDNAGKFLMYQRFVQIFLDKQLEGMSSHKRIYVTPPHTKKIFGNIKKVGKGFSRRETPLFPTMVVQNQAKIDEAVYKERDDSLERAAITAIGLDAKQDRGGGPRRQETMGDTIALTRSENVSKFSNDPLPQEKTKTAQAQEITTLKLRVKKLDKKGGSGTHKLKRLYKGRKIDDIDKDVEIILVRETQGRYGDEEMFDTSVLDGDEVLAEPDVTIKDVKAQDKCKGIIVEELVKMKKKDQISLDEELAFKLQAEEEEEEERLAREKAQREEEANI